MFSPPVRIMDAIMNRKQGKSNNLKSNQRTPNQNNNILVEKQTNVKNSNNFDHLSDVQDNSSDVTKTPGSFQTNYTTTSQSKTTNMDYTPSPLSVFSKRIEFSQAIVILISSDIIFKQQHAQQQNALMILLSKKFHLPVKVVDANDEKEAHRREELFCISGLKGQYPQIFLVDSQKRLTYLGHHVSLEQLLSENVGEKQFSPSLMDETNQNRNANGTVDESFFSI